MQEDNNPFDNPFKAPTAVVADQAQGSSGFIPEGRKVPIGSSLNWLGTGWRFFKEASGVWIGIALIFLIIQIVIGLIPFVNLLGGFILPILVGGLMLGCKAMDDGEPLSINQLFAGFSGYAGRLFLIGLLDMVYIFVLMMLFGIAVAIIVPIFYNAGSVAIVLMGLLGIVLFLLIIFPMFLFTCIAPALVVLQDQTPVQAMVTSFKVAFTNILPLFIYMIILFVLSVIASIPVLLGLLVLVPVFFGSIYAAYCDIFFEETA